MKNVTEILLVIFFSLFLGMAYMNGLNKKELLETKIQLREYKDNHDALQIAFDRCMEEKNDLYEIHKRTIKSEKRLNDEVARLHGRDTNTSYYGAK